MNDFELTDNELYSLIRKAFLGHDTQNILGLMHSDELLKVINLAYKLGTEDSSVYDEVYSNGYRAGYNDGYYEGQPEKD